MFINLSNQRVDQGKKESAKPKPHTKQSVYACWAGCSGSSSWNKMVHYMITTSNQGCKCILNNLTKTPTEIVPTMLEIQGKTVVHHNLNELQLKRWLHVHLIFVLIKILIIDQPYCFTDRFTLGWFLVLIECTDQNIVWQLLIPDKKWMVCHNNKGYAELSQLP